MHLRQRYVKQSNSKNVLISYALASHSDMLIVLSFFSILILYAESFGILCEYADIFRNFRSIQLNLCIETLSPVNPENQLAK